MGEVGCAEGCVGIESDQLVYDYLSRVGDVAQQQQLPSGTRMRLVSTLRNEIDRQRGKFGSDNPASVRRILGRLGEPDEVVRAATGTGDGGGVTYSPPPEPPAPAVPEQRTRWGRAPGRGRRADIPRQKSDSPPPTPEGAPPPHLAGMDEMGPAGAAPDWWRVEPGPLGGMGSMGAGTDVPGFVGGVEIPELLKPPMRPRKPPGAAEADDADEATGPVEAAPPLPVVRRLRLRRRRGAEGKPAKARAGLSNPLLLLAAALLVAGAFLGSWLALGGGWLLAYASRTLSRAEAKWAVFGLPGVAAAGGLVWLWGETAGRWGDPIPQGGMGEALSGLWPVVVRTAAVASALYLVWRARRRG